MQPGPRPAASPAPPARFFGALLLLAVAACAAYAGAVLVSTSLASIQALDGIAAAHERWHIRPVTAEELRALTVGLGIVAVGLGLAGTGLAASAAGRRELAALFTELRLARAAVVRTWARLPRRARIGAAAGFAVLTVLRTYFSLTKPLHAEEIASYEFFVSQGLLAVSAYYPIPNNHILSSALSWAFFQVSSGFWWSIRLPVLLVSTAGTAGLFLGLLRRTNFRVALLATGLFGVLQLSLYNASAGRGYWLLITLAGGLFFCALALGRPASQAPRARLAWAGLLLGGLAGAYTVPTFAYPLASTLAWLGWQFGRRGQWAQLCRLATVALALAAGVAALYAPVLLVSGGERLVGNGFVAAQAAGVFWPGLPGYLWFTEGMLAGQRTVGAAGVLLVLVGFGYWRWRMAGLATGTSRRRLLPSHRLVQLGNAAVWFALFPYALVLVQRVFPPERVLLYKSFFLFALVGLLADAGRRAAPARWQRALTWAVAAGFALFAGYQTYYVEFLNRQNRRTVAAYRAGFEWLRRQPVGPVLAPEPLHNLYFRFYAHTEAPGRYRFDHQANPARRYAYVVAFPNHRGAFQPAFAFPPAYRNAEVEIFALPSPGTIRPQGSVPTR